MKIVNKTPFEVETIPFKGPDGKAFITVIVKGTFDMLARNHSAASGEQIPIAFGDEPYDPDAGGSIKFEADTAPFKPRSDIVLVGHAHAPQGQAVSGIDVSLRVGSLRRVLRVYGDRIWKFSTLMPEHPSRPQPFVKMPIVYERAFGGVDMEGGGYCRENLVGCGFFAKLTRKGVNETPVPNIEDPDALIDSPKDHPRPVGYGYYGRAWEPRVRYLGTYDEQWRKNRAPDPPADFKYEYYNAAHPDLQIQGYLRGNEPVELLNLSADGALQFQLCGVSPTCRVTKAFETLAANLANQDAAHPDLDAYRSARPAKDEVAMNLDTLCLIPDQQRYFMIWRGRSAIYDLTALEVQTVEIAQT